MKTLCMLWSIFFVLSATPRAHAQTPLRGMYYGSNMFGSARIIGALEELLRITEINAVIIDKKDDHGMEIAGERFSKLVRPFKDRGAHIVCRVVTLKDNTWLRGKGSAFALYSRSRPGTVWHDYKGNSYLDPASEEVAAHHVEVTLRAFADGCEMINYDYIRLPSARDGNVSDTKYPLPSKGSSKEARAANMAEKRRVMQLFTKRLVAGVREVEPTASLAVSIFGYACYGREPYVGQYLEDFAGLGFIISCMAYPSHYSCGDGAPDPNTIPYETYHKTHRKARAYLAEHGIAGVFMPWLQGFDYHNINRCGGGKRTRYATDPPHFRKQIQACADLGIDSWFVWPSRAAFHEKGLFLPKGK